MEQPTKRHLRLPIDLFEEKAHPLSQFVADAEMVTLEIPDDYEVVIANPVLPGEVFAIQRLLTLARSGVPLQVIWSEKMAKKVQGSAPIFPLLAVLLTLQGANHELQGASGLDTDIFVAVARKGISQYRLMSDLFSASQVLLCADSRGQSRPADLYENATGQLRRREDFETLVIDVLSKQLDTSVKQTNAFRNAAALGVIVAELFENTDLHGRFDVDGTPLTPDAMRGVAFKRVKITLTGAKGAGKNTPPPTVDCLEVSVFDTGVGYFSSYTKQELKESTSLDFEWKVLHNCLERHYFAGVEDKRPSHRAMGLAEVLRALQALKGRIDVRTGRLFAYRTFMEGDLQAQMEELSSPMAHFAFPRPKMLDVEKKYLAIPSAHEKVIGSAVRVVVPLG